MSQKTNELRRNAIKPTRKENFPEWYQQVVRAADLAELSDVRGCMIIKPNGFAIWERMQTVLDRMLKETGLRNAYFPLFIPKSFLERETAHVEGFAKECAVVTHSRLVAGPDGKLIPASPLDEPLIVRPTSEVIIGAAFSRWIQSYRDLPLLINQWANVVRMEMRPRIFLRTVEFLWQEGHTAHATAEEARDEALRMLEVYRVFAEDYMRLPVICGRKTDGERFPGAVDTYAIEAMMQDGKALQAGTSHFLGQNFSRACSIKFADGDGTEKFVHTTSFGVSTRLIGGLIMALGDDDGLVLAPDIAPVQVAILPMVHGDGDGPLLDYAESLGRALSAVPVEHGETLRVEIDRRQLRGGEKFWQKIRCGIPILVEIGARELAAKTVTFAERGSAKKTVAAEEFTSTIADILKGYGDQLFQRQLKFRKSKTVRVKSLGELKEFFADGTGFAEAHFCGDTTVEKRICSELPISTRCVPFDKKDDIGPCIGDTGRNGPITIWAKAY